MLQRVKAVVLSGIKYSESSVIIHAFTDKFGRQSFLVHGVRKKKNKVSAWLLQPLNLLEMEVYYKESRELHKVKEVHPFQQLSHLHFDMHRSAMALFLGEVLHRTLREASPNDALFNYLVQAIQILDVKETGIQDFHLVFLLQLSKFIGIYPGLHSDLSAYKTGTKIELPELLNYSLSNLPNLNIDGSQRMALLEKLLQYYYDHVEGMGKLKSLEILHTLFHD